MRQIPNYLIIGSGRLSKHLSYYFALSNLSFNNWSRANNNQKQLEEFVKSSYVIILAISDDAIANFIEQNLTITNQILVHCSGSLAIENAIGMHPLMSFSNELYDHKTYQKIPFIVDSKIEDFKKIFPTLNNQAYFIPKEEKAYYHALCVMSGNFTTILWSKLFQELEMRLNIPKEAAFLYLEAITHNLLSDYKKALTGPIIRGDQITINKNLESLKGDPFLTIYQAFIKTYGCK